jgi:type IV secretion system protein VirB2
VKCSNGTPAIVRRKPGDRNASASIPVVGLFVWFGGVSVKKRHIIAVFVLLALAVLPDAAYAAGGITDLATPLERVVATITGPVGKAVSIIALCVTGLMLIFGRSEMAEGVKMLCGVVFAISFIAFAANIVDFVFPFTGAVVG